MLNPSPCWECSLLFVPDHLVQNAASCSVTCRLCRLLVCYPLSGSPPPPLPPPLSPCVLWSCSVLPCRQKTLTWPCWPAFLWLCLIPLSAGGYPLLHLLPFPVWFFPSHPPPRSHHHLQGNIFCIFLSFSSMHKEPLKLVSLTDVASRPSSRLQMRPRAMTWSF